MSAPRNPRFRRGSAPRSEASHADPGLRASDAERAEVADRLSKHSSDGRLDQATFNERLDQAMNAKTHADLSGLLADLPGTEPSGGTPPERDGRRRGHRILFLVLVVVVTAAVGQTLVRSYIPWLLLGLLAFLWLRYGPRHGRRL